MHLSIVGGEPLVRHRELEVLLPKLGAMGMKVQLVTSAVRRIPVAWASLANLHLVVSIDGLPAEHDRRRSPATYDRILKHISDHRIVVHCAITRQMLSRADYFSDFASFWSDWPETRAIWFSLFTPQFASRSEERLTERERAAVLQRLARIRHSFPKIYLPDRVLDAYSRPPVSPSECFFAQQHAFPPIFKPEFLRASSEGSRFAPNAAASLPPDSPRLGGIRWRAWSGSQLYLTSRAKLDNS